MSESTTEAGDYLRKIAKLEQLLEAAYVKGEKSLPFFLRQAWKVLEPGRPLLYNWHHDLIAEYLMACHMRQIKRLLINVPPRYMKSNLVTVSYPVWTWLTRPEERFITASHAQSLSTKHSVDRRRLIESQWFQWGYADRFQLATDQNVKTEFQNDKRGHMFATSMGGATIGRGGNHIIIDDPHDARRAESEVVRESDIAAFDQKFTTRLDDKESGVIIVVMQRLHERDLTGHLLKQGGWEHLNLPAQAPAPTRIVFPVTRRILERQEGDILHPQREGQQQLDAMKRALGPRGYQAQYQQDPSPMEGGFVQRAWWRRWAAKPMNVVQKITVWDCAEKPGVSNDYTVAATWWSTPDGFFLIDRWRERVAFPELERACLDLYNRHRPDAVVIEDKSAGTQLIQNMRAKTTLPIVPYQPGARDKVNRLGAVVPTIAAGNCYLPEQAEWVEEFIAEHERFPNVEHDDQADTTSMALDYFRNHQAAAPRVFRL